MATVYLQIRRTTNYVSPFSMSLQTYFSDLDYQYQRTYTSEFKNFRKFSRYLSKYLEKQWDKIQTIYLLELNFFIAAQNSQQNWYQVAQELAVMALGQFTKKSKAIKHLQLTNVHNPRRKRQISTRNQGQNFKLFHTFLKLKNLRSLILQYCLKVQEFHKIALYPFQNLKFLLVTNFYFDNIFIDHLSKANWINLKQVSLLQPKAFTADGAKYLTKLLAYNLNVLSFSAEFGDEISTKMMKAEVFTALKIHDQKPSSILSKVVKIFIKQLVKSSLFKKYLSEKTTQDMVKRIISSQTLTF